MASKKQVQRPALTQERQIRALRPESEPFEHSIKDSRGLLIRVSPKGKKVWVYRYRRRDTSKRERMTLGSYPDMALSDARTEVGVQRSLVEKHSSARDHRDELRDEARKKTAARVAAQKRSAFTVSALVEAYIQDVSTVGNDSYIASWRKVEKTLGEKITPVIGDEPANEIQRPEAIKLLRAIAKSNGPVMANRTASYLRRAFNWAVDAEKLEHNPLVRLPRHEEKPKTRSLSDSELRAFWTNAPKAFEPDWGDYYRLILLTALRPGEVAILETEHVDISERLITLPDTKNDTEHVLPLSKQALEIVKRRCANAEPALFPRKSDAAKPMRPDSAQAPLREAIPALKIKPLTPHDLRRTAATGISALQAPRLIVQKILNHKDTSVTAVYDQHRYLNEMRGWLQRWADHIIKSPKKSRKAKAP